MRILGNKNLLQNKKAVILNSRQSKLPSGSDSWIIQSGKAVQNLTNSKHTILTSVSLNTWEMIIYLTGKQGGNQIIFIPDKEVNCDEIFSEIISGYKLDPSKTAVMFGKFEKIISKPKTNWLNRDKALIEMADMLVPVSIKTSGNLDNLVSESGKRTLNDFKTEYAKPTIKPPKYDFGNLTKSFDNWDYITHWTRTCHGSWPGQSNHEYYKSIIESLESYPNNGIKTLNNILHEKMIRASSKRIRNQVRCIGFTEQNPSVTLETMKWLPKRVNWNFEPYGVAIKKDTAKYLGIKPVIYGDTDDYESLPQNEKPFYQSVGKNDVNWSDEKEWRHINDLDLKSIDNENIKILVWSHDDADYIRKSTSLEVIILSEL